jgi:hypothetical protein
MLDIKAKVHEKITAIKKLAVINAIKRLASTMRSDNISADNSGESTDRGIMDSETKNRRPTKYGSESASIVIKKLDVINAIKRLALMMRSDSISADNSGESTDRRIMDSETKNRRPTKYGSESASIGTAGGTLVSEKHPPSSLSPKDMVPGSCTTNGDCCCVHNRNRR